MTEQPDGTPPGVASAHMNRTDHDLLVRMETKLDVMLASVADHEKRLRSVEARMYALAASATVLGSGGGWGLGKLIGH